MQTNQVILTDLLDRPQGVASKEEAHYRPLLHRAFSVFLYCDGQLLVQQRALEKYHSGGLWANTCCSHPRPGEALSAAAKRRLEEETGLVCDNLTECFAFPYYHQFAENLFEYEYDHVFVGKLERQTSVEQISFAKMEIAALRWVGFEELLAEVRRKPQQFAPWFIIAAPLVVQYLLEQQC